MPASKISTEHRAQRAARTGAAGVPSEWAAVIGQTADFEPERRRRAARLDGPAGHRAERLGRGPGRHVRALHRT